eukprot:4398873-Alexandrium_andersonii.AAC.1
MPKPPEAEPNKARHRTQSPRKLCKAFVQSSESLDPEAFNPVGTGTESVRSQRDPEGFLRAEPGRLAERLRTESGGSNKSPPARIGALN